MEPAKSRMYDRVGKVMNPPPSDRRPWKAARRRLAAVALASVCGAIATATPPRQCLAQDADPTFWVTNGFVRATALSGNTLYLGGTFDYVGPNTGGGAALDVVTGRVVVGWPHVEGEVMASAADGHGGWFLGGRFSQVGGLPRANVAHVASDGTVTGWSPDADDVVLELVVRGGIVYAGGQFTTIGGQERRFLAALDATTGQASPWDAAADAAVFALWAVGGTVYVGGDFTHIGGEARPYLAALDAATGMASAWNPASNGAVSEMVLSGSALYVVGRFSRMGVQSRNAAAALDVTTAAATTWNPGAIIVVPSGGGVYGLSIAGSTVYLAGDFVMSGGTVRYHLAAVDARLGAVEAWNPRPNAPVISVAARGATVYVGGWFIEIDGVPRRRLAALDAVTGAPTEWDPIVSAYDPWVVEVNADEASVFVGGHFDSVGGDLRSCLAAIDLTSRGATFWDPHISGGNLTSVHAVAVSGSIVYAGGDFQFVGGVERPCVAAIDATTGSPTIWNPAPTGGSPTLVRALASRGDQVYVGGEFTRIGGQERRFVAGLNAASGLATEWNAHADDSIHALVASEDALYAGGVFHSIGGRNQPYLAALDPITGHATSWDPQAGGAVLAITKFDRSIYVGGAFETMGGQPRRYAAALDAVMATVTPWDPSTNSFVLALAVDQSAVYLGGYFEEVDGQERRFVAAVDPATGLVAPWNPQLDWTVNALAVGAGTVYVGGEFWHVNQRGTPNLAALPAVDDPTSI